MWAEDGRFERMKFRNLYYEKCGNHWRLFYFSIYLEAFIFNDSQKCRQFLYAVYWNENIFSVIEFAVLQM